MSDEDDRLPEIPRHRWRELIPRGTLGRVVVLLALLAIVVGLQRRSASIVHLFDQLLMQPAPAGSPRVRLAPPATPERRP